MNLKPQDVLFLLKLLAINKKDWSFNSLASDLGMSPSEVHAAGKRALAAGLANKEGDRIRPNIRNLEEFLLYGIQYVFVPARGGLTWGMPTSYAAAAISSAFVSENELPPVWPDPEGKVRGELFSPLYKSAPFAAKNDPKLYELLAIVDAIRGGRARESEIARKLLVLRLTSSEDSQNGLIMHDKNNLVIGETLVVSREALEQLSQKYHIQRLALFGSAARGKLKPESDVDLLVEFEAGKAPSLGGMVKLHDEFVVLFGGREVDVATPTILNNPYRRQTIEREMEVLYAA